MPGGGARTGAGRPPKPTALKLLQGTARPDRMNAGEPQPAPSSADAPARLLRFANALAFWEEHAPKLLALGLLTELDREELTTACEQHEVYVKTQVIIMRAPSGKRALAVRPINHDALASRDRILARFGFDPSSRAKISVKPKEEVDAFEALMLRKRGTH